MVVVKFSDEMCVARNAHCSVAAGTQIQKISDLFFWYKLYVQYVQ